MSRLYARPLTSPLCCVDSNETLRIFPAVPNCTQRQVPRTGNGITVDGVCVFPVPCIRIPHQTDRSPSNLSPPGTCPQAQRSG